MFESINLNTVTNINKYVSDIIYEDENGWCSLVIEKYNCTVTRISEKMFKIELCVDGNVIDTNIELL